MKLSTLHLCLMGMAIGGVVGQLPTQLVADLDSYRDTTIDLRFNFVNLPADFDTKSQVSAITNGLARLSSSINTLNTTATDLAAQGVPFAPADAAQLVDEFQIIAGNTTIMIDALVTKTYFCQSFGGFIDSAMVPAKETIFWTLNSLSKITPDPFKSQLSGPITSTLTNGYFKALVYRNLFNTFPSPCIPWGTA